MKHSEHGATWEIRPDTHDELIVHQAEGYFTYYKPQPGWTVIDIGAHIGAFAVLAAKRGATVYAFEPEPENFDLLKCNIAGHDVRAFRNAVVGKPGKVQIYKWEKSKGNTGSYTMYYGQDGPSFEAWGITLAEALILAGGACDLLKLDCEGAEYDILMSARPETLRAVSRIILEWHISRDRYNALKAFLVANGFVIDSAPDGHSERLKSGELYEAGKMAVHREGTDGMH